LDVPYLHRGAYRLGLSFVKFLDSFLEVPAGKLAKVRPASTSSARSTPMSDDHPGITQMRCADRHERRPKAQPARAAR
jgi:hypothetical protein